MHVFFQFFISIPHRIDIDKSFSYYTCNQFQENGFDSEVKEIYQKESNFSLSQTSKLSVTMIKNYRFFETFS